jgi:hypothetical protein
MLSIQLCLKAMIAQQRSAILKAFIYLTIHNAFIIAQLPVGNPSSGGGGQGSIS